MRFPKFYKHEALSSSHSADPERNKFKSNKKKNFGTHAEAPKGKKMIMERTESFFIF